MAEKLCTLRTKGGGGGKYTETSLWTNANPSASAGFAAQTVTLSESIDNFKYIAFKYKFNNATDSILTSVFTVEDVKKSVLSTSTHHSVIELGIQDSSNYYLARPVGYVNSTSIQFLTSYRLNGAASSANGAIPLEILGLNELDHAKGFDQTVLWTNGSPSATFANTTVTLSDNLSNYDFVKIKWKSTTSVNQIGEIIVPVSVFASQASAPNYYNTFSLGATASNYFRPVIYASDTTMTFGNSIMIRTNTTNNDYNIVTEVIGLKFA